MATKTTKTVTAKSARKVSTVKHGMFPKTLETMLRSSMAKGHDSKTIAEKLNSSAIALKNGLKFSPRSIAVKMGNITRTQQ
jgi:hypothetical protein